MLVTMKELLLEAQKGRYAVGAFNVPNLESVQSVIAAAEELRVPVILQHAEVHEDLIPLEEIGPIMLAFATKASVPVGVHFDHGTSFNMCVKAMKLGFTSVMIDASSKPYEENYAITSEICAIAHALNVSVEAELGHVFNSSVGSGGREATCLEDFADPNNCYTDPRMAKDFVEGTGVDALAVAFGTVHGVYVTKPVLDLDRITLIQNVIPVPLVMHGGSGISDESIRTAINNGITKINYYTYGAMAGAESARCYIESKGQEETIFAHELIAATKEGIKKNVKMAMSVFATNLLSNR